MTSIIIITVLAGAASGYFFLPDLFLTNSELILNIGLCLLLFMVGIDMGRQKTVLEDIKRNGLRILSIPVLIILGTLAGAAVSSLFLSLTLQESLAVSAGFGWYSLAPIILSDYSAQLSAIAFIANVLRELFAIILIPIVAKRIGYLEAVAPAAAAGMDTCLPIVENSTNSTIAVYSFVSGVGISLTVPILIPLIMGL